MDPVVVSSVAPQKSDTDAQPDDFLKCYTKGTLIWAFAALTTMLGGYALDIEPRQARWYAYASGCRFFDDPPLAYYEFFTTLGFTAYVSLGLLGPIIRRDPSADKTELWTLYFMHIAFWGVVGLSPHDSAGKDNLFAQWNIVFHAFSAISAWCAFGRGMVFYQRKIIARMQEKGADHKKYLMFLKFLGKLWYFLAATYVGGLFTFDFDTTFEFSKFPGWDLIEGGTGKKMVARMVTIAEVACFVFFAGHGTYALKKWHLYA